jgi:hypothetical protein
MQVDISDHRDVDLCRFHSLDAGNSASHSCKYIISRCSMLDNAFLVFNCLKGNLLQWISLKPNRVILTAPQGWRRRPAAPV